jgi:hypothetical protein
MEEEMVEKIIYTTCPEAYDYSQATTLDSRAGRVKHGSKIVRKVLIRESQYRVDYQIVRYRSTMCELCVDETEWQKLLDAGIASPHVVERDTKW